MAFSEIELKRIARDIEAFMAKHRPPPIYAQSLILHIASWAKVSSYLKFDRDGIPPKSSSN